MRAVGASVLLLAALAACDKGAAGVDARGAHDFKTPARTEQPSHRAVTEVSAEEQVSMHLEFAVPSELNWSPVRLAYGRVVSDPTQRSTVRAPFAGRLLAGDVSVAPGQACALDTVVFRLVPRWSPQERADLEARAIGARAELATAGAELPMLEQALERAHALNAQEKSVSDREVEEADARVRATRAKLSGAQQLLQAVESSAATDDGRGLELVVHQNGTIVEQFAHAGDSVEAGDALIVVEDFTRLLVSIELPLDGSVASAVGRASITPSGRPDLAIEVERVGLDPQASPTGLATAILFRILSASSAADLRPGLIVSASLPTGAPDQAGRFIARSAVVRLAGERFVYVRSDDEHFERRALTDARAVDGGWFVPASWSSSSDGAVVIHGAQSLLSLELLGRQGGEEE